MLRLMPTRIIKQLGAGRLGAVGAAGRTVNTLAPVLRGNNNAIPPPASHVTVANAVKGGQHLGKVFLAGGLAIVAEAAYEDASKKPQCTGISKKTALDVPDDMNAALNYYGAHRDDIGTSWCSAFFRKHDPYTGFVTKKLDDQRARIDSMRKQRAGSLTYHQPGGQAAPPVNMMSSPALVGGMPPPANHVGQAPLQQQHVPLNPLLESSPLAPHGWQQQRPLGMLGMRQAQPGMIPPVRQPEVAPQGAIINAPAAPAPRRRKDEDACTFRMLMVINDPEVRGYVDSCMRGIGSEGAINAMARAPAAPAAPSRRRRHSSDPRGAELVFVDRPGAHSLGNLGQGRPLLRGALRHEQDVRQPVRPRRRCDP